MLHARIIFVGSEKQGFKIIAKTGSQTRVIETHTDFYRKPDWDNEHGLYLPSLQYNYPIERPRLNADILLNPRGFGQAEAWTYLAEWERVKGEHEPKRR